MTFFFSSKKREISQWSFTGEQIVSLVIQLVFRITSFCRIGKIQMCAFITILNWESYTHVCNVWMFNTKYGTYIYKCCFDNIKIRWKKILTNDKNSCHKPQSTSTNWQNIITLLGWKRWISQSKNKEPSLARHLDLNSIFISKHSFGKITYKTIALVC